MSEVKKSFPYTVKYIENRESDYVCFDCGRLFLTEKQKEEGGRVVTSHMGKCGLCKKETSITHMRAFNWLRIPKS